MNKKDLIEAIAKETTMPETKVKMFLDSFFNIIGKSLSEDQGVKIIGYLDFTVRQTNDSFIHPVTKAVYKAKYKKAVRVKIGKTLKAIANGLTEKTPKKKTK